MRDPTPRRAHPAVTTRLRYRPPYDWPAVLDHLEARTIAGVEEVREGAYRRSVREGGETGTVEVRHEPAREALAVTVRLPSDRALPAILGRVQRLFDLDADIGPIARALSRDPFLAPLVARRPGLRVPGAWDGFELGVRAVLGQQVSVAAARRLAAQLVEICGQARPGETFDGPLARIFPSPARLAAADLGALGMPAARRAALGALARASLATPGLFRPAGSLPESLARLRAIPGVGEWTAQYIALRALRENDAFPAGDVGLLRGASRDGRRPTAAELLRRAERWRPWRAYAAQHLWAADAARPPENGEASRG